MYLKRHWVQTKRVIREAKPRLTRIQRHSHDVFHVVYCMDMSATVFVGGQYIDIGKNDLLLIAPQTEHAFYIREKFLTIEAKFRCDSALSNALSKKSYFFFRNTLFAAQIMRDVLDEALKQDVYFEDMINEKILILLLSLLRQEESPDAILPGETRYRQLLTNKDAWLSAVTNYIDDNLNKPLSVRDVAEHFGYSSGYFSNIFQKKNGAQLGTYIAQRKIETAKELLTEGWTVTEAANRLGFTSIHHFSKKFKAMVGVCPGKYGERVRVQLAVNVNGTKEFPPTGMFEYHPLPWDGENYL